jgi:hypothetical protein
MFRDSDGKICSCADVSYEQTLPPVGRFGNKYADYFRRPERYVEGNY